MHEIYEGIDEGLTNLKQEFIVEANKDAQFVENMERYNPINMIVREISADDALQIKEEHSTTKVYFDTEQEFEEVRILTTAFKCEPSGKYYSIQFFTSTVETDDIIENMFILLVVLWLTLGILLLWASRRIIKRSSKPFNELLGKLQYFNLGNTKMIEFPKTNIAEFKSLNNTIEVLLKENIQAYKEQKIFIENASHELQTPLAVSINRVELLMGTEDISEVQLKELSSILSNLNRMKRLNNSLLLLSKIRNKQFPINSDVDMKETIEEVFENFEGMIEHKQLLIQTHFDASPIIKMNNDLAHIMINNLVKNAINYNVEHGRITVRLNQDSFTILNDGNPISDGIDIFERYTSGETRKSSAGLGLSIVSSIAHLYNFKIEYSYKEMHSITVFFR